MIYKFSNTNKNAPDVDRTNGAIFYEALCELIVIQCVLSNATRLFFNFRKVEIDQKNERVTNSKQLSAVPTNVQSHHFGGICIETNAICVHV